MRIHFRKPYDWDTAYLHYWNAGRNLMHGHWPGLKMEPDSQARWYSAEIPIQSQDGSWANLLFHDNQTHQTQDLSCRFAQAWVSNGNIWPYNPDVYKWFSFPNGNQKALVLSFDDGSKQDKLLIRLLESFQLKGTFHINSGLTHYPGKIPIETIHNVYRNHEISAHSLSHPYLDSIDDEDHLRHEVETDRLNLQDACGCPVRGFAYPFGVYTPHLVRQLPKWGFVYGRTVKDSNSFTPPADLYQWHPTCHHHKAHHLAQSFLSDSANRLEIFFIWGHSWELDNSDGYNWHNMYDLCEILTSQQCIWSAGATEIANYLNAITRVELDTKGRPSFNPKDNETVFIKSKGTIRTIPPGNPI